METMSQFRTLGDLYKARSERFARALVDVMAGMGDSDIKSITGLDDERCEEIARARADSMAVLELEIEPNVINKPCCEISLEIDKNA